MAPRFALRETNNYRKKMDVDDHTSEMTSGTVPTRTTSKAIRVPVRKSSLTLCKVSMDLQRATPTSQFLKLPPEIIQQIASLLPTTTAAVFTFTCTTIRSILGTQYWDVFNDDLRAREHLIRVWLSLPPTKPLPSKPHAISQVPQRCIFNHITLAGTEKPHKQCTLLPRGSSLESLQAFQTKLKPRRRLLELLSRDTPDLIRCGRCMILHSPHRKIPAVHQSDLRECEAADKRMGVDRIIYAGFTFPHAQYAMKLHRAGIDTEPYLKSLARRTRRKEITFRIYDGELYMRAKYFISLPSSTSSENKKKDQSGATPTSAIPIRASQSHICTHLSINNPDKNKNLVTNYTLQGTKNSENSLDTYIQSHLTPNLSISSIRQRLLSPPSNPKQKQTQQCKYCETEFLFTVFSSTESGNEAERRSAVLTKWMNLGSASTCSDGKWTRHFDGDIFDAANGMSRNGREGDGYERIRWVRGDIKSGFENGGGKNII